MINEIEMLLTKVSNLKEQDKRLRKVKGEDFNLFSIMRMETNENNTHSNIIGELLDPSGSHNMGDIFLRSFLTSIYTDQTKCDGKLKPLLDVNKLLMDTTPKISLEHHIGFIDNKLKTGGRIDILIEFGNQHTITIENKINAPDQHLQLKRYHNFRKGNNDVFYLTKEGGMAGENSADDLTEDDIYCISYEKHIKQWMERAIQIAAEQPILRESLRQYLLLIKKITNQMTDELQNKLKKLIAGNLEIAALISDNFKNAESQIREDFRLALISELKPLANQYKLKIEPEHDVNNLYSKIHLKPLESENPALRFAIESFSGNSKSINYGEMIFSIILRNPKEPIASYLGNHSQPLLNDHRPIYQKIAVDDINLTETSSLSALANLEKRNEKVKELAKAFTAFFNEYIEIFKEVNKQFTNRN